MMDEVWDLGMLELKSSKARRGSSQKIKIKRKINIWGEMPFSGPWNK